MADIYIGNVKGPQGETGATGAQGPQGDAATISVGTVSTTEYGNTAQVTNTGTSSAAVFDFVIPQGRPGEETTQMSALTLDTVTAQSAEFPIPATGESGATVFGKIIKFFNDAKTAINSKINISDIVNNLTSTATNKPLSAAQGKALNDALTTVTTDLETVGSRTVPVRKADYTITPASGATINSFETYKFGRLLICSVSLNTTVQFTNGASLFSVAGTGLPMVNNNPMSVIASNSGHGAVLRPVGTGTASIAFTAFGTIPIGSYYAGSLFVVLAS